MNIIAIALIIFFVGLFLSLILTLFIESRLDCCIDIDALHLLCLVILTAGIIVSGFVSYKYLDIKKTEQNADYKTYCNSSLLDYKLVQEIELKKDNLSIDIATKTYSYVKDIYSSTGNYNSLEEYPISSLNLETVPEEGDVILQIYQSINPPEWEKYEPLVKIVVYQ